MITLAIEASANKCGIGILRDDEILSNLRVTYVPPMGQGFIPIDAANFHRKKFFGLITQALDDNNLKMADIDIFAYTRGPGIFLSLHQACLVFRTLSILYNKPLVPVNHCIAHIEMGRLITGAKNPVILYASGGNTQIIAHSVMNKKYKILGETMDVPVGNLLDKVARQLGLSNFPSPGASIEKEAKKGKKLLPLPYNIKGMDFCFSGIGNSINNYVGIESNEDICYSLQETLFAMLVEATERALSYVKSSEVLLVGGVGCNLRLQEMLAKMIESRGGNVCAMDDRFCIDNGPMIGFTGFLMYKSGMRFDLSECDVTQRFRTDSVLTMWRE